MKFIGVVHLLPLPGSPRGRPLSEVLHRACSDAEALQKGGADAIIVENFGDAPFARGAVSAATVAMITCAALRIREIAPELELGINVLRNDAMAAVGVAHAVDASFIRVNVHTGTMVTDQGIIEGEARRTLLERMRIGSKVSIAADVLVKHAVPLGEPSIHDVARDTAYRGLADVLIVTGTGTGQPHSPQQVATIREAVPDRPIWVGSGVNHTSARSLNTDGAIVGTCLHEEGDLNRPLCVERIQQMASLLHSA